MRARAVRARRDDRLERGALGAELDEERVEPPGELALRPAREPLLREPLVRLARDRSGRADRIELVLVLDRAQRFDEPAPGHELQAVGGEGLVLRVGDHVRLEADAARDVLADVGPDHAPGLDELDSLDGAAGLRVAEVAEQQRPLRLDHERGVRAREPDEVADVRPARDEQGLFQRGPQPIDPFAHETRSFR